MMRKNRNLKNGEAQKIGTIVDDDIAIATTCTYEKSFEQDGAVYHHILDPADRYRSARQVAEMLERIRKNLRAAGSFAGGDRVG